MKSLLTFEDPKKFLMLTYSFLEREEAVNNLILGLATRLAEFPEDIEQPPLLLAVEEEQKIIYAALMTPPRALIIYGEDEVAVELIAQHLVRSNIKVPELVGKDEHVQVFLKHWEACADVSSRTLRAMRVFQLNRVEKLDLVPGSLRLATLQDKDLVVDWMEAFEAESMHGEAETNKKEFKKLVPRQIAREQIYLWESNNQIVSMSASLRSTRNGITISAVYTPPEWRGKGYATACVASLSQHFLDAGWKFCSLFTDLANPTSNHIYEKIGYRRLCDWKHLLFLP